MWWLFLVVVASCKLALLDCNKWDCDDHRRCEECLGKQIIMSASKSGMEVEIENILISCCAGVPLHFFGVFVINVGKIFCEWHHHIINFYDHPSSTITAYLFDIKRLVTIRCWSSRLASSQRVRASQEKQQHLEYNILIAFLRHHSPFVDTAYCTTLSTLLRNRVSDENTGCGCHNEIISNPSYAPQIYF